MQQPKISYFRCISLCRSKIRRISIFGLVYLT